MAVSEAHKRATAKWDAENMKNVTCRLRKETVERFRDKCKEKGVSPNTLLREFIERFIEEN